MIELLRYHLGFWARVEALPDWCTNRLEERRFPVRDERFTDDRRRYRATLVDGEERYYVKKRE